MSRTYWRSAGGTVHVKVDGRSLEQDNLDDAHLERVASLAEVELGALCARCFPPTSVPSVLEATEAQDDGSEDEETP
jgi:hypothetical protein